MGEVRDRMEQDLILHGMAPRTQEAYLTAVQGIAKYYHQRPDTLREAQLQTYIRSLLDERHLSASSVRVVIMGLRFFYTQTLRRPWPNVPLPKRTKTLPEVLSREEVARLLASTTTVRQRAVLMTTYGGGLRVSEVVRLQVSDIDAGCGMLRVEQGKGRKDRYTLLGPRLLAELRRYWQLYRRPHRGSSPSKLSLSSCPSRRRNACTTRPRSTRTLPKRAAFMRYATRLRPTSWKVARIWRPCNVCWATRV